MSGSSYMATGLLKMSQIVTLVALSLELTDIL